MRIISIAAASLLAASPALAQDKSREVVGSDAKVILKTTKTMVDKSISLPQTDRPEITMMVVTMEPNGNTSLHKHPSPTFGYVMEGAVEVRAESVVKKVKAGSFCRANRQSDADLEYRHYLKACNLCSRHRRHTRCCSRQMTDLFSRFAGSFLV